MMKGDRRRNNWVMVGSRRLVGRDLKGDARARSFEGRCGVKFQALNTKRPESLRARVLSRLEGS